MQGGMKLTIVDSGLHSKERFAFVPVLSSDVRHRHALVHLKGTNFTLEMHPPDRLRNGCLNTSLEPVEKHAEIGQEQSF